MRDYSKVSPAVWQSERFNSLPSDDGRFVYLYLLTNGHQTSAGAYRLPDGYACVDLRWPEERYVKARAELVAADLIEFDTSTSVLMISRWFRHNPPMNRSHLRGIERLLEKLPSPSIRETAWNAAQVAWEAVEAAKVPITPAMPKPGSGLPRGVESPISDRLNTTYLAGRR